MMTTFHVNIPRSTTPSRSQFRLNLGPQTMKVLVHQADKTPGIKDVPYPVLNDRDVLVRTEFVALNPTDWKGLKYMTDPGNIMGCDYSGRVIQIGKNVTKLAVGDRVAGFVPGGIWKGRGAFAEYIRASEDFAWKVPDGTVSQEQAATFGCALWTAVQALFHPKRLGLVEPPAKVDKEEWIFIYGGSSSVGQFAIQLAHLAGYKVVTVCSAHNFALCRSLGADHVFSYKDPSVIRRVKDATNDSIRIAFDAISTEETLTFTLKMLAPGEAKVMTVLEDIYEVHAPRPGVEMLVTMVYTTAGVDFVFKGTPFRPNPADRAHAAQFVSKIPGLVQQGLLTPNPVKLLPGGLDRIQEGLRLMEEGHVSGEKLVYCLCTWGK